MSKIQIISDTSCDLSPEDQKVIDVCYVPFSVTLNGEPYKQHTIEISNDEFYSQIIDNPKFRPKSACPSTGDYFDQFKKFIKQGKQIICLCLTQKFSGSYNSAKVAREMILEENPNAEIAVIDSECITVLQGMLVKNVVLMIKDGLCYETIITNVESLKKSGRVLFTIGSTDYLQRGGRMGKLISVLISKVNIKPIINFEDGDISSSGVTIGRTKSLAKVLERIKQFFSDEKINIEDYDLAVGYGYDKEEGENFLAKIQQLVGSFSDKVKVGFAQIGAVIGVHTGPLPLGLGFIKRYKPIGN